MSSDADTRRESGVMTRRTLVKTLVAIAGAATIAPRIVSAQTTNPEPPAAPPNVETGRDFGPNGAPTTYFTDPDIISVDPSFSSLVVGDTAIQRLWTGAGWAEGPAWNSEGRYFLFSDISNNRQMRWIEDDGHMSVFRNPSNNSNGNTFDYQGRQISCEHLTRRVVRYELDGSITVLADNYQGAQLNSPNDVVPHTDGSVWFTDPPYGGSLYEGAVDAPGGPSNPSGLINSRVGQPVGPGTYTRTLPTNVYRWDPSGRLDIVINETQVQNPNGLCFSPDQKRLYVVGSPGVVYTFDVTPDNKCVNQQLFSDFMINGIRSGPDGIRCDVYGNLWSAANAGRNVGYSGVTVWTSAGKLLGRIRIPEVVANITFGGPKRNRLFMAASQSIYALYVNTQGAAPG
jgi:gluconolactonase